MSARLFKNLKISQKDILKFYSLLDKFKKANSDMSIDEEDFAMSIIENYCDPKNKHIKNMVNYNYKCGYNIIAKQWRHKYYKPADFTFINCQNVTHISQIKFQHMLSRIRRAKDIEALYYVIGTQKLLTYQNKSNKTFLRKRLGISRYKQEQIIERIKHYYG
jgi:hypothetical protein